MMRALIVVLMLSGCTYLPSVNYCDHVLYERTGERISIQAECTTVSGLGLQ